MDRPTGSLSCTSPEGTLAIDARGATIYNRVGRRDEYGDETMEKELLAVQVDADLKRRVEEATAKHKVPVDQYLVDAIEKQLAEDVVAKKQKKLDANLLDEMRELREQILADRGGSPIEIQVTWQLCRGGRVKASL